VIKKLVGDAVPENMDRQTMTASENLGPLQFNGHHKRSAALV